MRLIPLNGIFTDGRGNVDKLAKMLSVEYQIPIRQPDYKTVNPLTARWAAYWIARGIAGFIEPDDVLICHSFGCIIGGVLMELAEVKACYMIAPAASRDWQFDKVKGNPVITAFYSPDDYVVRLGSWLPFFHPFGRAGIEGYSYPGVVNIKMQSDHNDFFRSPLIEQIKNHIAYELELS